METATLDLVALKAANCAVSTEETRYYLNGILVEITANSVIYVATNGRVLFAHKENICDNMLTGNYIIPREIIATIKVPKIHKLATLSRGENGVMILTFDGGMSVVGFTPIDSTFPDWRRVFPSRTSGEIKAASYDPNELIRLWKAGKIMDISAKPSLSPNDENPAIVCYGDDNRNTVGLIMPMRNDGAVNAPDWVHHKPEIQQAA